MSDLEKIPRPEKLSIAKRILQSLQDRLTKGPKEPALDAFIPEVDDIVTRLNTHVTGTSTVKGDRAALLATADASDDEVDTWLRHIESYLDIEGRRRTGPNVARARALHEAAFPDGLAHVDDRVIDENNHCRDSIAVLRVPENVATLKAIKMPLTWVDAFEAAITKSDADNDALIKGRTAKSAHISHAQNVEEDWEDAMLRLRHNIAGRAKRSDIAKKTEGQTILAPLLAAVKKIRIDAAARATRRGQEEDKAPPANAGPEPAEPGGNPTP